MPCPGFPSSRARQTVPLKGNRVVVLGPVDPAVSSAAIAAGPGESRQEVDLTHWSSRSTQWCWLAPQLVWKESRKCAHHTHSPPLTQLTAPLRKVCSLCSSQSTVRKTCLQNQNQSDAFESATFAWLCAVPAQKLHQPGSCKLKHSLGMNSALRLWGVRKKGIIFVSSL